MSLTKKAKKKVLKRYNYECAYCGSTKHLTVDHIKPKVLGGTGQMHNLQALCNKCNFEKDDSYTLAERNYVELTLECSTNKIEDFF